MPDDVDIDDRDEPGTDAPAIIRRLNKVLRIQQKATTRLERIKPHAPEPGPPDLPTVVNQIVTEAQKTISVAQSMLTRA
jgi:hypothetical protein